MPDINNDVVLINELVKELIDEEERTKFANIFHSIKIPSSVFKAYCTWSNETYTRNCIEENDQFELILLCWEKDQKTSIHDHNGEECWVKFIQGEFKESIFKEDELGGLELISSSISKTGDIAYISDNIGCHRLENISGNRSISLHLYAKPIRSCRIYDENSRKFIRKSLSYDTVSEKAIN